MSSSEHAPAAGGGLRDAKTCASCGRTIEWRKKWTRDWDQVRYCSARCRRRRVGRLDRELEAAIVALLAERAGGSSICPSEAARAVAAARGDDDWRALMELARSAARRLAGRGEIEITQRGRVVDPDRARGPVRLRRAGQRR